MDAVLTKLGVEHITRIGSKGGHSFGLGNGLEVSGWLEEAVDFFESIPVDALVIGKYLLLREGEQALSGSLRVEGD